MGIFRRLLEWLWDFHVARLVCLHYCAFVRAGSTLRYTHVHVLRRNAAGATGLGHDDETDNTDPGHASVSKGGTCTTQAEDAASMALRGVGYLGTAYFHEGDPSGESEEGFTRIACRCGGEATVVCYTMDYLVFKRWYDEQKWRNRTGRLASGALRTSYIAAPEHVLPCGTTIVIEHFAIRNVAACAGYATSADGGNDVVREARDAVRAAYDRIRCFGSCNKSYTVTFTGWKCAQDSPPSGPWVATAKVQWTVVCA